MRFARIGWVAAVVALLLSPLGLYAFLFFGPRTPTDFEEGYRNVRDEMSVEEVRRALGAETRETTQDECQVNEGGRVRNAVHGDRVLVWEKNGQFVRVGFVNGRVVSKYFFEYDL